MLARAAVPLEGQLKQIKDLGLLKQKVELRGLPAWAKDSITMNETPRANLEKRVIFHRRLDREGQVTRTG